MFTFEYIVYIATCYGKYHLLPYRVQQQDILVTKNSKNELLNLFIYLFIYTTFL